LLVHNHFSEAGDQHIYNLEQRLEHCE
jgi:hypothetical protein